MSDKVSLIGGIVIRYKNPIFKKRKNTHVLEVSCGNCKTPIVIYQKGGKGNLIKMQFHLIIESVIDIENNKGHLQCTVCKMELAKKGTYNERNTYWINRGKINTKRLGNYYK